MVSPKTPPAVGRRLVAAVITICFLLSSAVPAYPELKEELGAEPSPGTGSSTSAVTTANLRAVTFVDSSTGFAVGTGGTILKTGDSGLSWRVVNSGGSHDLRGVSFIDASNGWVVSLEGVVFKTTDGGETWSIICSDISGDQYAVDRFHDVEFLSSVQGWAVGGAQGTPPFGWHTYNGGISSPWESYPPELWAGYYDPGEPNPPNQGLGRFYAVDFPSPTRGWAVGVDEYVTPNKPMVVDYDESRAGTFWLKQTITGNGPLYDVSFANTTTGVTVGSVGRAYRTTNGGATWTLGTTGVTNDLLGVVMSSTTTGYAVGKSGRILKTTNGGTNWTVQTSPTAWNLEGIAWAGGTTVVAVGDAGTIVRTTNGTDWSIPPDPPRITVIVSTTHETGVWSNNPTVNVFWGVSPYGGMEGYSYVFDKVPNTTPDEVVDVGVAAATVTADTSGVWYFHVRAKDTYGRWGDPAHFSVSIDLVKPSASDDAGTYYMSSPAVVNLSGTDSGGSGLASISYSVDGGLANTQAGTPVAASIAGEGAHTLEYWATDNAGNSSTTSTVELRIDITPPEVSDDHVPYYTSSPAGVTVTASDPGGSGVKDVRWKVDGGATQTQAGSSKTVSIAGEGAHTLEYWATDNAGNSASHVTASFAIDTIDPTANDDIAATYTGSAVFTLWGSDAGSGPASVSYILDGGGTVTVAEPSVTLTVDESGSHSIEYWVADAAGNESGHVTESFDAGTDTAPPTLSDDVVPYYKTSPAVLHLSATDGGVGVAWLQYRLDAETSQTVNGPATTVNATVNATGEGEHSITYTAQDSGGHTSSPVTRVFRIDTVLPTASSDAQAYYTASPAAVIITASDPGGSGVKDVRWKVDGGATQTQAGSSKTVSIAGEGAHTLEYWATDNAGNASVHATANFRIDVTPPVANDDAPAFSSADPTDVTISATDVGGSGVDEIHWKVDGGGVQTYAGSSKTVSISGEGAHTLEYWATDNAGNSSTHVTRSLTIDTIAPGALDAANAFYNVSPAEFEISGNDSGGSGVASMSYVVDDLGPQTVAGSSTYVSFAGAGAHTIEYWATDRAGNESAHTTINPIIDLVDPVVVHNGVPVYSGVASVLVTASDALSGVQTLSWRLDDGETQTATGPAASLVRAVAAGQGDHTLVMWAEDVAGNVSPTTTFSFKVLAGGSERLAARTRFSTAVAIAREGFDADGNPDNGTQWDNVRHVVIASGDDRAAADPLAASGLCWAYDAPLFLVSASSTPVEVKAAIKEIALQAAPGKVGVHIVGGPVSVPDARYSEIAAYVGASKLTKDRLLSTGGRYDMAAKISSEMQRLRGRPDTVLIANGADSTKFFDALALSPIAAANGYPILLVTATSIPPATQTRINAIGPTTVIVGGGPNTVSDTVRKALGAERWYGRSRYDTAIDIADEAIAREMLSDQVVGIAAKLPDALTGGSMVGLEGGVLLLTDGASLTTVTGNWLSWHKNAISWCYIFGGENSMTRTVKTQIDAKIK